MHVQVGEEHIHAHGVDLVARCQARCRQLRHVYRDQRGQCDAITVQVRKVKLRAWKRRASNCYFRRAVKPASCKRDGRFDTYISG